MAGRRIRRPEPKRRAGGAGCLLQFLVAAVCAVALGYLFGNYLFSSHYGTGSITTPESSRSPAVQKPAPSVGDPNKGEAQNGTDAPQGSVGQAGSITLPDLAVFQVQVGAFGQAANADRLVQQLRSQGYAAEKVAAGNLTQVRVGAFFGRPKADEVRAAFTTEEVKPVVITKELKGKKVSYGLEEEEYYKLLPTVVGSLAEALLNAEEGAVAAAQGEVNELLAAVQQLTGPQAAKEELIAQLTGIGAELKAAAGAAGEQQGRAVSRAAAAFAQWYDNL
ncbi:MAG: SPOR domain-containing protein [Firmicutes bacterium]|nr:SPOR domain-containing protein [Bacillota bacterium]